MTVIVSQEYQYLYKKEKNTFNISFFLNVTVFKSYNKKYFM